VQVLGIALQGVRGKSHPLVIINVLRTTASVSVSMSRSGSVITYASRCCRFIVISINKAGGSSSSSACGGVCIRRIHVGQPHPLSVDRVHLDTDRLTTITLTLTLTMTLHAGAAV